MKKWRTKAASLVGNERIPLNWKKKPRTSSWHPGDKLCLLHSFEVGFMLVEIFKHLETFWFRTERAVLVSFWFLLIPWGWEQLSATGRHYFTKRRQLLPLYPKAYLNFLGFTLFLREYLPIREAEKQSGAPSLWQSDSSNTRVLYHCLSQWDFVYRPFCFISREG